jgi:uncharacterized protein (TIGR00369 family)
MRKGTITMNSNLDPRAQGWIEEQAMDDFTTLVGPLWSRMEAGAKRYAFLAEQKHLNRYGGVHGGMLLWLADKALSMKAWEACERPHIATLQLDVQFVDNVKQSSLVEACCEVIRKTSSIVFVTGRLQSGDKVVAMASGVWKYR